MADAVTGGVHPSLTVDFDAGSLYTLRSAVAAHASQLGLDEPQLGNLLLGATELATNAIRHGGGTGRLLLWRDGDLIRCQVSDNGPGITDTQAGTREVPLHSDGGRGLWIIRQFAQQLDISRDPGTTVTITISLQKAQH